MDTAITKVSVFLRTIGSSQNTISILEAGSSFDAANFSRLDQGNPNAIFDNSTLDYYGSGCMKVLPKEGSDIYVYPAFTYPIIADSYGKYKLFVRVKSDVNSVFSFSLAINDISVSDHEVSVTDDWSWVYVDLVIPDTKTFNLTFIPKTENSYIDSFYLTKGELPSSFVYSSSYITLHQKIFIVESGSVGDSLPIYQYKTTIDEIIDDNWYNFETTPLLGHSSVVFDQKYAIALFSSGSSDENYLIWDYGNAEIDNSENIFCGLTFDSSSNSLNLDCSKNYAIKAYSFRDSLDESACKITVPASSLGLKSVEKFNTESLDPVFVQTKIVNIDDSSNKVSLSLPDRLLSVVMDQSGSMSWNDKDGLRHTMTQRMVDRLESTYPGEVKYSLLSLGSTPIKINFYAVVENNQINTSSQDVANSYFFDQESGYAGVRIIRKKGSYPTSPLDGDIVSEGFLERAYDENLDEGVDYFYAAYTFDSNGTFSNGKFINAYPRIKTVPYGVGGFTYRVITGSGVRRDENLIGSWHLNESKGFDAYDFSDNSITLSSSNDLIWLNSSDVPSGVSGLRFDGNTTNLVGFDLDSKLVKNKYTFMAWVYPFNFNNKRTIISRENDSGELTFDLGVNDDGSLFITMDNVLVASSSGFLSDNQWNHIAVTVDGSSVKFYINGFVEGSGTISKLGNYSSSPMNFYIGGKSSIFFGKITEVSIHDEIRSDGYISMMSYLPTSNTEKVKDNGDRIVILKYTVPEDFNYNGGSVSIIRKEEVGSSVFSYESDNLILNGFGEKPSSESDGTLVYENLASVGSHSVVLPYNYIHGRVYDFRIYSKNSIGNYSLSSDSPILSIQIPNFQTKEDRDAAITTPSLSQINNVTIRAGNHKAYLQWDSSQDSNVEQIFIYWSSSGYPVINNETGVDSTSLLVFSGNPSDFEFVDRNLENETVSYYAVIASDRYGNLSTPVYVSTIPFDTADESGIPLLEIKQFRYEIVDENTLSLAWDAPVKFQNDIQSWFDQRVILYAEITDEFGSPITDASNISFIAEANVKSAELAEDVFSETINRTVSVPDAKDCYVLSSTVIGNGLIKGFFRMTTDLDILSAINSLSANIKVSYTIPDRNNSGVNVFEFTSLPVHIEMLNPFAMELVNIGDNSSNFGTIATLSGVKRKSQRRSSSNTTNPVSSQNTSGDIVKFLCKQTVPLEDQSFISSGGLLFDPDRFKQFDGCWIRRSRPFVARVVVTYRGQSLPVGSNCNAAVFEASDPECDPDDREGSNPCSQLDSSSTPKPFVPSFSNRRSRSVQPPATSIPLKTGLQRLQDGSTKQVSYADIPLYAPNSPQSIMLFGKTSYNGFYSRKKMYVVFDNILRIETTVEVPETNCIDVSEQHCRVYMIDPNSPNIDSPIKIPVSGQQVVRWNLRKGRNAKDRPFYSTDNVPSGPGIFSYTRSGSSNKVFFGPACGVTWEVYVPCPGNVIYLPEMYAIKASVVYDGLSAFEERPAILYPPNFNGVGFGSRFLMSMTQYVNVLYADGYDLTRVTIYHDPNISGGSESNCFRQCAEEANKPIFVLDNGQIIDIESGSDFEILYGDDLVVTYDDVLEEYVVTQENQSIGFAQVPLVQTGSSTSFYLRVNKFIGRPKSQTSNSDSDSGQNTNSCSCVVVPAGLAKKKDLFVVNGRTTINFNGETRYLRGGGDLKTGIPPTTIDLREPLDISIVDIRRNGESVEKVLCDGLSVHEFVVEVKFKEKPVPNGTPVFVTIGGKNPEKIILQRDTIYTQKTNDSILNPDGNQRSFTSFFVEAINAESAFESQVQVETNYDKRGDAERSMTACITIKYDPSQPKEEPVKALEGEINNIYSSSLDVYDTINNEWVSKSSMNYARGCLTLNWAFSPYSEQLYAIGGINGKSILSYNEMYDISTDSWIKKKRLITPRFYHMSAQDGNYIYVFGGITAIGSDLLVTDSVERYNIETDEWESLENMPSFDQDSYGIALGCCVVVNAKAYIIGGIRKIGQSGSIDALNDRVLVFDFDTLTWSWSDAFVDSDLTLYERIYPFVFVDSDGAKIHVTGGAVPGEMNTETGEQPLEFITNTFVIELGSLNSEITSFPSNSFPLHSFPLYSFPSDSSTSDQYITLSISLDDYLFDHLPVPRYRGSSVSIFQDHYFLGGTSEKSQVLNVFDIVTEGSPTYTYDSLESMPLAKTSFGASSDQWQYIYVAGGLTSGRPAGFLQIKSKVNPSSIRLDGKQSSTVYIELINDIGDRPAKPIRVIVQGILVFPDSQASTSATGGDSSQQQSDNTALRDALVYPVIFSSNDFYINDGIGSTIMLPRADDILKKISEITKTLGIEDPTISGNQDNVLKIIEGEIRNPYKIKVRITVVDDFYYGQTVVDIKDNEDETVSTTPTDTTGGSTGGTTGGTTGGSSSNILTGCRNISASQFINNSPNTGKQGQGRDSENNQTIDQTLKENDNPVFDLNPPQTPQLDSPEVSYYSDIEWIPQIITHVDNGEYSEMTAYIGKLKNSIPFGASPLYDALVKNSSLLLSEDLDKYVKSIYVNTDNEENLSVYSLNTAIENVQAIDGFNKVPVVINNFSVVFPVTLSALVSRTDTDSLDKIANETGGESQTVLDENFVDEVLNNSIGRIEGSIGWGLYECIVDLNSNSIVNSISLDYELFPNTDGNWSFATSEDGFNYSEYSDNFNSNTEIEFTGVNARYLKFKVTLLSGLSASVEEAYETIATPGVPSLTSIKVNYSIPTESYIYFNPEILDYSPQQISVAVSATRPALSQIQVGATTSNSYNWIDYQSGSQPSVDRYGKIVVPIRYNQDNKELNEPLQNINGFMWKSKYGRWDSTSAVVVIDGSGNVIDSSTYKSYPQDGLIVFDSKKSGSFYISIENAGNLKMGIKIINMDSINPLVIDGLGYMYNTNVFLPPPLSQRPPVVSEFRIVPSSITVYQKIGISYKYHDINQLEEVQSETEIKWYINGVEIEYLRNLRTWNDIEDSNDPLWIYAFSFVKSDIPDGTSSEQYARQKQESIIKVNDSIYATIKSSDGVLYSSLVRSPSVAVIEAPPFISSITIKGKKNDGSIQSVVTSATRAFADFEYFQDSNDSTKSQIIWYVNGIEFKRGDLNSVVGGISNNEILVGETKNNILGISLGNILEVTILPASQNIIGNPVSSSPVSVENDPPSVRNVTISPNPRALSSSSLQLTYTYVDTESQNQGGTQNDQSSVRWFKSLRGSTVFVEISSLQNARNIPAVNTSSGERWKAEVIPFDGISVGKVVQSNIVEIA